jgi:hypothetical protein
MNPKIPVAYDEVGRWLHNFAVSHAKREDPRAEAIVETGEAREGHSYGLRLVLDGRQYPAGELPPLEFGYAEVAEGRTRFAWCEALAQRLRAEARRLAPGPGATGSA